MSTARIHERVVLSRHAEDWSPLEREERRAADPSCPEAASLDMTLDDLGKLYHTHAPFVARFIASIGAPRGDVEDLVHEVFLVAHRRGGYRAQGAKPTTWLAAIAWRIVGTHRRGLRRRDGILTTSETSEAQREAVADGAPDAFARQAANEQLSDVQRALATLEPEQAAVFVLFEIEQHACADIAETLGLPVGTVHSRLHYARTAFNESFARISRSRMKVGEPPPKGQGQP